MDQAQGHSLCVADPEIKEVLDLESGDIHSVQEAIGSDYSAVETFRMRLAESVHKDNPAYVCTLCGVGVYLVCQRKDDEKRFHFRHRHEDGSCPAVTRGTLSADEINARKYNGVKESRAHIRMKEIIAESLSCDPDFSDVIVDKVWKGQDRVSWRKPDVRATWRGSVPVAFEVQLSTTFLHVIAGRRNFYREHGGLLCWVFKSFDAEAARMTQDDVFYNNNHNLFLASEQTLLASQEQKALMLNCQWTKPSCDDNGQVIDRWQSHLVRFEELTQDLPQQRVFLFDYDAQREALQSKAADEGLRLRFGRWWASHDWPPSDETWQTFRKEFKAHGVFLPEWTTDVRGLLNALYTAKAGRPVGYRHAKLIAVAHTIADSHQNVIQPFRAALMAYDRAAQVKAEDAPESGQQKGRWAKKVEAYKARLRAGDPAYAREQKHDPLIAFLFPEVWEKLKKLEP